jgi:hypothetical protein
VDPNNKVLFLKTEKFVSYAFPFSFNDEKSRIPFLDSSGIQLTVNYNFTSDVRSEAAGVYLCQTKNALIYQAFWQMPGLFDQHCQISRFFITDSDTQEQSHVFNNQKLPIGSSFGLVLVRFTNLTMKEFVLQHGATIDAMVQTGPKSFRTHRVSSSTKHLSYINQIYRELVSIANSNGLGGDDSNRDFRQVFATLQSDPNLQSRSDEVIAAMKKQYVLAFDAAGELTLYYRNPYFVSRGTQTVVAPLDPFQLDVSSQDEDQFISVYTIPRRSNGRGFQLEESEDLFGFTTTRLNDNNKSTFQFSLGLSGSQCPETSLGPDCDKVPILLKASSSIFGGQQEFDDMAPLPLPLDDDDPPVIIPPNGTQLFYYNPISPNLETLLHGVSVTFNSTGELVGFSNSVTLPEVINATHALNFSAQNYSRSVTPQDAPEMPYWHLRLTQSYPTFIYNNPKQSLHGSSSTSSSSPQQLSSSNPTLGHQTFAKNNPKFNQFTWWVVLANPSAKTPVTLTAQTYTQLVCQLEASKTISQELTRSTADPDPEPVLEPTKCGFPVQRHTYDSSLHPLITDPALLAKAHSSSTSAQPRVPVLRDDPDEDPIDFDKINTYRQPVDPGSHSAGELANILWQFQPYTSKSSASEWSLNIAEFPSNQLQSSMNSIAPNLNTGSDSFAPLIDGADGPTALSFTLYLRRGQLPIIPTLGQKGAHDVIIMNYHDLSHFSSYKTPVPYAIRDKINGDEDPHVDPESFDLGQDVWYGAMVVNNVLNTQLAMWYRETCPNLCGEDSSNNKNSSNNTNNNNTNNHMSSFYPTTGC